ncbi:putative tubulin polyglutamylase TTLL9 [Brachionus plicatilis]|uniref:Tubulin--tyrosine ligase-like protein 9 n=1 Tax=Brachionus plicatilis TaxID=10195 RepID=A0A3M7S9H3_BRAPC|nr:putative tubulin polyglutamylase TTLL9 [Brachionus plicatilis]
MNQKQQNLPNKVTGNQSSTTSTSQTSTTSSGSSFSSFYQQMIANNSNIIIPFSKPLRRGFTDRPIKFRCFLQNTMLDVLKSRGWMEVADPNDEWDFYWVDVGSMKELFDQGYFEEHMRINHFRNHYELTRKDLMVKNLKRFKRQYERDQNKVESLKWDFFPTTFVLPSEYHMFVEEFKRKPGTIWIMKPAGRAQGKGIFLFTDLKDITDWKKGENKNAEKLNDPSRDPPEIYVVQRYLSNPYLIGGKKFDMRIYVLVTTFNPLKAYLYREGFARLSGTRFSLNSIGDTYVHITNNAIQKQAPNYDPDKGAKWSMQNLRQYLIAKHGLGEVETMFRLMDEIFIKSLQSVQKTIINDKHCFELYGYDILLDSDLKPWLIEINASPALTASSQEDYELKFRLLDDTLTIVDMENRLNGKEKRIGGFDLIWNDGPVMIEDCNTEQSRLNSFLGCYNDRNEQLKKLYRQILLNRKTQKTEQS